MKLDEINVERCFNCHNKIDLEIFLTYWHDSSPDLIACCSKKDCRKYLRSLGCISVNLTLEEAKVLIVKSKL